MLEADPALADYPGLTSVMAVSWENIVSANTFTHTLRLDRGTERLVFKWINAKVLLSQPSSRPQVR